MKAHGDLTADIGERLRRDPPKGHDVVYDHGPRGTHVGRIFSYFGDAKAATRDTALSHLDIAVIQQGSDRAVALVEIEETSARPKTILGDGFAVLVGDGISFHKKSLIIGPYTTLIIMVSSSKIGPAQIARVLENLRAAQPHLSGKNKSIGSVIVDLYSKDAELEPKLRSHIDDAIARSLPSPA